VSSSYILTQEPPQAQPNLLSSFHFSQMLSPPRAETPPGTPNRVRPSHRLHAAPIAFGSRINVTRSKISSSECSSMNSDEGFGSASSVFFSSSGDIETWSSSNDFVSSSVAVEAPDGQFASASSSTAHTFLQSHECLSPFHDINPLAHSHSLDSVFRQDGRFHIPDRCHAAQARTFRG
jgi:hypothetical protein